MEGIIVGESSICSLDEKHHGLSYRGYSIIDLAKYASFEEVAYLLTRSKLPNKMELNDYLSRLIRLREIPEVLKTILELLPAHAHPMEILRTVCSVLGILEFETEANDPYAIADRLIACLPGALLYWYHFHQNNKRIDTAITVNNTAAYFLTLLHEKKPDELEQQALNASLVLYAEHELNTSTFAARIAISTGSDFYSAICAAIGTLRGPLHGGANEMALSLIKKFNSVQNAEQGIHEMLIKKELIMGFGNRIYKQGDPRSHIIKTWARKLSEKKDSFSKIYAICECIEKIMLDEKNLYPNVDFYSAANYYFCDIPACLFTPLFVMARMAGWAAHILEQRANNHLIRPLAEYTGPVLQTYIPIEKR